MSGNNEERQDKGQFVQFPVHLIYECPGLTRDDKWVLLAIMGECWAEGTYRISYREISALAAIPISLLSTFIDKKTGKRHEGIINRITRVTGYINMETGKEVNAVTGKLKGNAHTYITINYARVWEDNRRYCEVRRSRQIVSEKDYQPVSHTNKVVSHTNRVVSGTNNPVSNSPSNVPPYITKTNKTLEDKKESIAANIDTSAIASSRSFDALPSDVIPCFFCAAPMETRCSHCGKRVCSEHGTNHDADDTWCVACVWLAEHTMMPPQVIEAISSQQATDEPLIAASAIRTTTQALTPEARAAGIAAMREEGDEQEQCETLQATFSGLVESGVLPPSEPEPCSTRRQESEGDADALVPSGSADGLHTLPSVGMGSSDAPGEVVRSLSPATRSVLQAGQEEISEGETNGIVNNRAADDHHSPTGNYHGTADRTVFQAQVTEGDTHAHPHSHSSGSSGLYSGLEAPNHQGQDHALQARPEGERALVEGVVTDENILPLLHGASLPDHHSLDASNGHHQVDSASTPGSADTPGVDRATHGSTSGNGTGTETITVSATREGLASDGQGDLNGHANNHLAHLASHHGQYHPGMSDCCADGAEEVDGLVAMATAGNGHPHGTGSVLDRTWKDVSREEVEIDNPDKTLPAIKTQGDTNASTGLPASLSSGDAKPGMGIDLSQTEAPLQAYPVANISRGGSPVAVLDELPTVEPGEHARDMLSVAPVQDTLSTSPAETPPPQSQQAALGQASMLPSTDVQTSGNEDMRQEPQMHVLVVTHQFVSVEEWKDGYRAFVQVLSDTWKVASPDFKQQFGDWHRYRKHYLERWQKANPKPADVLPPEVVRILEDWQALHKKIIPITKSDIDAAGMLAPCTPTKEELSSCWKWHFTTDDPKKPWYRRIGVSLMDVAKNWSKWQSTQEPPDAQSEPAPKTVSRILTKEELKRIPV